MTELPRRYDVTITVGRDGGDDPDPAEFAAGLPAEQRSETAWLPGLWWTCWLLSGLGIFGVGKMSVNSGSVPHIVADTSTGSLCFLAVAGVLLIAIIRTVSDGPVGSPLS